MEFNKAYSRNELVKFLRTSFLPEDFIQEETPLANPKQFQYTQQVTRLGESKSLGLVVFEVLHSSVSDARVGLTKEAFRMLADEFCERALVFFVPQDDNSNYRFSLIEITLEQKESSAKVQRTFSNPHRYSYYLGEGISYHTPNKYLNEAGRVVSIEDLRSRFSVEVLTKAFYQELSDWYAWAVKVVRFPNDLKTEADNEKYNSEAMIRLITRLIFVWFIKQRKLVPDEFFDVDYISARLIKDFNPSRREENLLSGNSVEYSLPRESHYYKGILQNLFFAMLNRPICEEGCEDPTNRRFSRGQQDYGINNVMRHENLFVDPKHFIELANRVPFLNGGLFDCLDEKDNRIYIDAFTDRDVISKQLVVPDALFFGDGPTIDLSEWYGDKRKKKVSARGIIDILKRYNFTVEENTPFDQDVSLDPELLGKVFENLLASYNPETQTTARKQTGSFYTPREIVQYMVDESLVAHLKRTVGDDLEGEYRKLIQYTDEEPNLTDGQRKAILQSIYQCKVLDPACGSGAFPMGMLQQMVHILNRIDPDNKDWKEMMVRNAISETSEAYLNATDDERKEMVADIERSFNENVNRPDYARKLYLIENCIYGVDIQPIAIQISKLRFFISLVVDQKTNDNPVDNFGIRPLPNLEAKFVAANTLIGLHNQTNLFVTNDIKRMQDEMKVAKHKIFGAKTVKTKRKYKELVAQLRIQMVEELKRLRAVSDEDHLMLLDWDMFDQNKAAKFFDPSWMFSIENGFDIVIANPPYIDSETMTLIGLEEERTYIVNNYRYISGNWDIYMAFLEKGLSLSKTCLVYITPDKWLSKPFGRKFRKFCMITQLFKIVHAGNKVFENATVDAIITLFANASPSIEAYVYNKEKKLEFTGSVENHCIPEPYYIDFLFSKGQKVIRKIEDESVESIMSLAVCENACATSDAYKLLPLIENSSQPNQQQYKLVNTGTIDKYSSKWGKKEITYLGTKMLYPVVNISVFNTTFGKSYVRKSYLPKIIIKGLNLLDAFVDVKGEYLPGKTTLVICSTDIDLLYFICGILNSKLAIYYIKSKYSSSSYCGGITFTKDMINSLPLPSISFEEKKLVIEQVKQIIDIKGDIDIENLKKEDAEDKLNDIIYHLYGLTYDEVLIVDPETPITKEEYESSKNI